MNLCADANSSISFIFSFICRDSTKNEKNFIPAYLKRKYRKLRWHQPVTMSFSSLHLLGVHHSHTLTVPTGRHSKCKGRKRISDCAPVLFLFFFTSPGPRIIFLNSLFIRVRDWKKNRIKRLVHQELFSGHYPATL